MKFMRKLLFPFSVLYGLITSIRNFLFDKEIFKSYSFPIPIIAVGNLSVGGTGKTPQIEYLICLLSDNYKIATLSRGYKRKSNGFILASQTQTATSLGDEPFQFFKKFPKIQVAVDADRKNGIEKLLASPDKPKVILLDDAMQHRKVKAGFYILLSTYADLFCDDFILPAGNLRESKKGAKRANIIIITKCPKNISNKEIESVKTKVKNYLLNDSIPVFFSYINYDKIIYSENGNLAVEELKFKPKLLVAGIANPNTFFDYLKNKNQMEDAFLTFPDHHDFSESDVLNIRKKSKNRIVVTTEKDYVRLKDKLAIKNLYYLPIKTDFIKDSDDFDKLIVNFINSTI